MEQKLLRLLHRIVSKETARFSGAEELERGAWMECTFTSAPRTIAFRAGLTLLVALNAEV